MKKADGFDDAIIGIASLPGGEDVVVYDYYQCCIILETRDGMTEEESVEYMEFNVVGAYVGPDTPVFVRLGDKVEDY